MPGLIAQGPSDVEERTAIRPGRRPIIFHQFIGVSGSHRAVVIHYLHYTLITIIANIIICMAASGIRSLSLIKLCLPPSALFA